MEKQKAFYPQVLQYAFWAETNPDSIKSLWLVNKLEADPKATRIKPTSGMQIYDEEFYKKEYNKKSAIEYIKYAREVEKFISKKDWNLELKFNKHYCGFKAGFFNAFGIQWVGTKTFAFFFKLSEYEALFELAYKKLTGN